MMIFALITTSRSSHAFQVTTGFAYFNGCDGAGFDCTLETVDIMSIFA
jgi:hypothetical protein